MGALISIKRYNKYLSIWVFGFYESGSLYFYDIVLFSEVVSEFVYFFNVALVDVDNALAVVESGMQNDSATKIFYVSNLIQILCLYLAGSFYCKRNCYSQSPPWVSDLLFLRLSSLSHRC